MEKLIVRENARQMEQELIERGEGMGVGPAILVLNPVPKSRHRQSRVLCTVTTRWRCSHLSFSLESVFLGITETLRFNV